MRGLIKKGGAMVSFDEVSQTNAAGDIERLQGYFASGFDANTTTKTEKWTLLHKALLLPHAATNPDLIALLIDSGCHVNAVDASGNTALHYAARKCDEASIGILLSSGADPNAVNSEGRTPLQKLLGSGRYSVEAVQEFLQAGADPDLGTPGSARKLASALEDSKVIELFDKRKPD
ncbi:ankyrin repeat domain-containing protein [Stieleria neptunia]|nr:ankyrin repeat domain-containing protein [Stieleria neptunia]